MKKLIFLFAISIVAIGGISMMPSNEDQPLNNLDSKTCEYQFSVTCPPKTNGFTEIVRARSADEAKKILHARYPDCRIITTRAQGQNCK